MLKRRARAISLLEVFVVGAIISLLVAILLPSLSRARELCRQMAEESAAEAPAAPAETEEMAEAREAAQEMAEDLEIDDRVRALAEAAGMEVVEATVLVDRPEGSDAPPDARRRTVRARASAETDGVAAAPIVTVSIDGTDVYISVDGGVRMYLGAGEWEGALDRALWQVLAAKEEEARLAQEAREAEFKRLREEKYGPLPCLDHNHRK